MKASFRRFCYKRNSQCNTDRQTIKSRLKIITRLNVSAQLTSAGLDEGAIHQITRNSCRHGGGNLRTDCIDRPADTNPTLGMRIGLSPMAFLWRSVLQRRSPFKLRRCQELGKAAGAAARGACRRPQRMLRELAAPLQHRSGESRGRRPGS